MKSWSRFQTDRRKESQTESDCVSSSSSSPISHLPLHKFFVPFSFIHSSSRCLLSKENGKRVATGHNWRRFKCCSRWLLAVKTSSFSLYFLFLTNLWSRGLIAISALIQKEPDESTHFLSPVFIESKAEPQIRRRIRGQEEGGGRYERVIKATGAGTVTRTNDTQTSSLSFQ